MEEFEKITTLFSFFIEEAKWIDKVEVPYVKYEHIAVFKKLNENDATLFDTSDSEVFFIKHTAQREHLSITCNEIGEMQAMLYVELDKINNKIILLKNIINDYTKLSLDEVYHSLEDKVKERQSIIDKLLELNSNSFIWQS